jgi:membrane-associated phospholipid phosphatase
MEIGEHHTEPVGGGGPISPPASSARQAAATVCGICPYQQAALVSTFLLTLTVVFLIDLPVARFCTRGGMPGWLRQYLNFTEPFGHGVGVATILVVAYWLDPGLRRKIGRMVAMSLGAGLLADVVKLFIERTRPKAFDFEGGVFSTFGHWFPGLDLISAAQSFPSAHTATAVGLAFALSWQYPRARGVFFMLAAMVAFQRVTSGNHFPSDTVCGAAIGWATAMVCLYYPRVAGWFERRESGRGLGGTIDRAESAPAGPCEASLPTCQRSRTRAA